MTPRLIASSFFLFAALLLSGCAGTPCFGPGTLTFENQRSRESSAVQYRMPDGTYDAAGLWQISYLMRDTRAGEATQMDPALIEYLDAICARLRLRPGATILITSGYRASQTNADLRRNSPQVADNSYHLRGQALDFKIPGISGRRVYEAAKDVHRGGYAYYPSSDHVHIDTGPYRTWSSY